ncbi:MAG: GNAT family N-acetyltransferase [Candidatus Omnitrophota bacterium]
MKYMKDITLKAAGAKIRLKFLQWDTGFFGRPSFLLDAGRLELTPSSELDGKFRRSFKDTFITAKIDTATEIRVLDFLYSTGFKYINTEVTLKYQDKGCCAGRSKAAQAKRGALGCKIEKLETNEGLPYSRLGSVFTCDRFHSDPHIRKEKADLLWINYLKNFKPSATRFLFVARIGDEAAGVILCHKDARMKRVFLAYVAVAEKFAGAGVGTALIQHVIRHFRRFEMVTETQVGNISAMNFYIRNGFSVIEKTRTILHRWSR